MNDSTLLPRFDRRLNHLVPMFGRRPPLNVVVDCITCEI